MLFYVPSVGLNILWNGLIPVAPALVVIAPGLWRNICPMATFSLLPRRLGLSRRKPLPRTSAALLAASGMMALFIIVPLRHLLLNTSGPASAVMLLSAATAAFLVGISYDWRSGWCNGLCPIHPVEKLYGQSPAITLPNARCDECHQCSTPCPDSTRSMHPLVTHSSAVARSTGHILAGSFAGFIWGWYQVPDYAGTLSLQQVAVAYAWPFGAGLVSLAIYGLACHRFRQAEQRRYIVRLFAASAVIVYYWHRIPALAGFGMHADTGMLVDLSNELPYLPWISRVLTTSFFAWFLLIRPDSKASWTRRPSRASEPAAR
jgi:hypothetical protein